MGQSVEQIETFFEAKFEAVDPGPGWELHHFDGFVHWTVFSMTDSQIHINADSQIGGSAFPVVELTAYCSDVSSTSASGVGPVLILQRNVRNEVYLVLTKTREGRISLSVSVGAPPESGKAEPGASPPR